MVADRKSREHMANVVPNIPVIVTGKIPLDLQRFCLYECTVKYRQEVLARLAGIRQDFLR
jgi:hypothetical protein